MSTKEKLEAENARLKADAQVILKHLDEASADCARLKAENERLREAGDALVSHIRKGEEVLFECLDGDPVINEWNAAKEGKPSA